MCRRPCLPGQSQLATAQKQLEAQQADVTAAFRARDEVCQNTKGVALTSEEEVNLINLATAPPQAEIRLGGLKDKIAELEMALTGKDEELATLVSLPDCWAHILDSAAIEPIWSPSAHIPSRHAWSGSPAHGTERGL
jgi:hypothetical protein